MLEHLGETQAGQDIENAITEVLQSGEIQTKDMGGQSKTHEVGDAIRTAILKA
jgi:isocitrate/isopropylmalate dehydrogenase